MSMHPPARTPHKRNITKHNCDTKPARAYHVQVVVFVIMHLAMRMHGGWMTSSRCMTTHSQTESTSMTIHDK
jgi:hypothetical protein